MNHAQSGQNSFKTICPAETISHLENKVLSPDVCFVSNCYEIKIVPKESEAMETLLLPWRKIVFKFVARLHGCAQGF